MLLAFGCLCAFLFGAVPWALLVVRACKGTDLRTIGSGNVGATNASRAFATRQGQAVAFLGIYLLDAGKGFVPAWFGPPVVSGDAATAGALLGASAILGHVFCPFLGFRGGKGVATATGVLLALDWTVAVAALSTFFVVRLLTGKVFFGSLALGLALAAAAILLHLDDAFAARLPTTLLCCTLAAFLFWTHRSNLQKHFAGANESVLR
jgi:glycerol-3-phosphate acyltransferase PlsY